MFEDEGNRHSFLGLSLVEIAVVIVIMGLAGSLTIPRYRQTGERHKVGNAIDYIAQVRVAQERHHALYGTYTKNLRILGLSHLLPRGFAAASLQPGVTSSFEDSWALTLTRPDSVVGSYILVGNERGLDQEHSTLPDVVNPLVQIVGGKALEARAGAPGTSLRR